MWSTPVFSPDSQRLAYAAALGPHRQFVVIDGKQEQPYDCIAERSITFSPDSRRLAYWAQKRLELMVIVDGLQQKRYWVGPPITKPAPPAFSPDSRHVAYTALPKTDHFLVMEGRVVYKELAKTDQYLVVDGQEELTHSNSRVGQMSRLGKIFFDSPTSFHFLEIRWPELYLVDYKIQ